jgi:acetyl esterase/lipase
MKTIRRLVPAVLGVALLASTLTSCEWPEGTRYVDPVFAEYDTTAGITYRSTTTHTGAAIDLKLDIYEPSGDTAAERPVVMWMFGGAWRFGNRQQLAAYAQDSARRGYVGVTIDYRIRSGDGFDLVAAADDAYEDTVAALEWLRDHAAEYRLDPDAIIPAGYSAGAINALHALHRPADTPAAGAVAIAGFMFTPPSPDRGASIVFSGVNDTTVSHTVARDQCARSRDLGNVCRFIPFEGEGDLSSHLIGLTRAAEIQEQTAHLLFEDVLWPLGYRPERVDAAA